MKELSSNDPQHFKHMYNQHPILDIPFSENQETGQFHSQEWNSLIGEATKFVEYQD